MTNAGIKIVQTRILKSIADINTAYNRKSIGKLASELYNDNSNTLTWGEAQKQVWAESRKTITESRDEVLVLKARLSNLTTPIEFNQTEQFKVNAMHRAHNNGQNLNI